MSFRNLSLFGLYFDFFHLSNLYFQCIYGRSSGRKMINEASTVVQYHNK